MTRFQRFLCAIGWHDWRTFYHSKILPGVIWEERCIRCGKEACRSLYD